MTDKVTQNAFHILRIKAGRYDDFDIEEWRTLEECIIRSEAKPVQHVLKDAIYLIGEKKYTAAHLLLGAEFRRLQVLRGEE